MSDAASRALANTSAAVAKVCRLLGSIGGIVLLRVVIVVAMNAHRFLVSVAAAAALLLTGCGIPYSSDDLPSTIPDVTIGQTTPATTPAQAEPEVTPATSIDGECRALADDELYEWEIIGNVASEAGDIGYSRGQIVKVAENLWEVAVVRFVREPTQYDTSQDGDIEMYMAERTETRTKRYPVTNALKAVACLGFDADDLESGVSGHGDNALVEKVRG